MKTLTCAAARRRLHAFHDGELPVSDQIAVSAHLDWCGGCAATAAEWRVLRLALQAASPGRVVLSNDEAAVFCTTVVSRQRAEHDASALARIRRMFDDMHLVYAALGATFATAVCLVVMLGMMAFATDERPDSDRAASLAAVMSSLATPGTSSTPVDDEIRTRWTARLSQSHEAAEQDVVFALSMILTREGHLASLQRLRRGGDDVKMIDALIDEISRARLGPDTDGSRFGTSMVWLVTRTTVRGTPKAQTFDLPLPARAPAKKHIAAGARSTRV